MHTVVIGTSPVYIKDLLTPTKDIAGRFNLRSAAAGDFSVLSFRLEIGRRAFSVAGPMEWNALPAELRTINPLDAGRWLTDFSQTSYAAGSRLTY